MECAVRGLVPVSRASRSPSRELDPAAETQTNLFLLGEGEKAVWELSTWGSSEERWLPGIELHFQ